MGCISGILDCCKRLDRYEGNHLALRQLLGDLGIPTIFEYTSGLSFRQYRCLDLYVTVTTAGMQSPPYAAWFILGMDKIPDDRRFPRADHWMKYRYWMHNGSRLAVSRWPLKRIRFIKGDRLVESRL